MTFWDFSWLAIICSSFEKYGMETRIWKMRNICEVSACPIHHLECIDGLAGLSSTGFGLAWINYIKHQDDPLTILIDKKPFQTNKQPALYRRPALTLSTRKHEGFRHPCCCHPCRYHQCLYAHRRKRHQSERYQEVLRKSFCISLVLHLTNNVETEHCWHQVSRLHRQVMEMV